MRRIAIITALCLPLTACDSSVWPWVGDPVHIEAEGGEAIGEALEQLIDHTAPEAGARDMTHENGVWEIGTRTSLTRSEYERLDIYLATLADADPLPAPMTDLRYRFDPDEELPSSMLQEAERGGDEGFAFSIAEGTIPEMHRQDYRRESPLGREERIRTCYLEIPIEGHVPPLRYEYQFGRGNTGPEGNPLIDTMNAVTNRIYGHAVDGAIHAPDGDGSEPLASLSAIEPHPDHTDRLFVQVEERRIHDNPFAPQPVSACFDGDSGEAARAQIAIIGFPRLAGLSLKRIPPVE